MFPASWLIERVSAENAANRAATIAHVEALMAEVRALRDQLRDAGDIDHLPPDRADNLT